MILINGRVGSSVDCLDRGLQYGDGLFETLRIENGQIQHWSLHWQRLVDGCERLYLPFPNQQLLLSEIEQVIAEQQSAVVKIIYTRGVTDRGYAFSEINPNRIVACFPMAEYAKENWLEGVELFLCKTRLAHQPLLAGLKHLNRLENVLARNEWRDKKFADGLMCCTDGFIIEATMSNFFLVKNGRLKTADLSQCGVAGVMRAHILQIASKQQIETSIENLTFDDLQNADEVFICNSVIGIWPVKKIDSYTFVTDMNKNGVTRTIQALLNDEFSL